MCHVLPSFPLTDAAVSLLNVQQSGTIPDPRSQTDRRQRDGLGLLPKAVSHEERLQRQHLNRLTGTFLTLFGTTVIFLTISHSSQSPVLIWSATMTLGTLIALKGVQMITWLDRRKAARRGTGHFRPQPDSGTAVRRHSWLPIGQVFRGHTSRRLQPDVTPPELD